MAQLEHIEKIEKRLWSAADTLRANSNYASNEYFLPVMGLVFLRHAYSRFLALKEDIEAGLPTRHGKKRQLTKEDFAQKNAIFLRPEAQFDYLVTLSDSKNRADAVIAAMESIEDDYDSLQGALPKSEYQELDNNTLGSLLRTLNPDELKEVSGDVFGRIYEYFLTQFADQKAHDSGEFFTPVSLVSLIARVLDPQRGVVLDPACGSGGMFVQSARTVEEQGQNPTEQLTFRGMEKNAVTIRLARMNLAVHGLEGDIRRAITYYEDPHETVGKADYVMANPPFNVDEIDADKIRNDPRLPFGLPGVNKNDRVSNGNYVWISYFHSYLNDSGRAGFVMSSQASSAGGKEAEVRRKLIETGDVDVMIAIRSNFFYTRTVPCELWFLDRAKPRKRRDKVLMIDARNIYRKVTRKIYDFNPEQQLNLLAIVWLYRGETQRFVNLVLGYLQRMLAEGRASSMKPHEGSENSSPLMVFIEALETLRDSLTPFPETRVCQEDGSLADTTVDFDEARRRFDRAVEAFRIRVNEIDPTSLSTKCETDAEKVPDLKADLYQSVELLVSLTESGRDLIGSADEVCKQAGRVIELCEKTQGTTDRRSGTVRGAFRAYKATDEARGKVVVQLERVLYYHQQAQWLVERFPDAELRDVEGLVKLVDCTEIKANDWSLTPGRYVGVAPEEENEDFDFRKNLRDIHEELENLNTYAVELALRIRENFIKLNL